MKQTDASRFSSGTRPVRTRLISATRFGPWALVTGASSGIGKEFARQLAAQGVNLVLTSRRLNELEALGRELAQQSRVQYRAVAADLAKDDALPVIEQATR